VAQERNWFPAANHVEVRRLSAGTTSEILRFLQSEITLGIFFSGRYRFSFVPTEYAVGRQYFFSLETNFKLSKNVWHWGLLNQRLALAFLTLGNVGRMELFSG
jgi:hypothetical protein